MKEVIDMIIIVIIGVIIALFLFFIYSTLVVAYKYDDEIENISNKKKKR